MAAIGGIFDIDGKSVDTGTLINMSRAMMSRGGGGRGAYVNGGIGIFSGIGSRDRGRPYGQPVTLAAERGLIVAVLDGNARATDVFDGQDDGYFGEDVARLLIEGYATYGTGFVDGLCGSFAAAIFDEARGELILIRDRQGSRPLFWMKEDRRIAFASEIKGLMRFAGSPLTVDTGLLREYVFAPYGACGANMIYRDIYSIPSGCCTVCSRLGMSSFKLSDRERTEHRAERFMLCETIDIPDADRMRKLLGEVLFAFDYPQFDVLMPGFLARLGSIRDEDKRRSVALEDGTLRMDIGYSEERRDRLCSVVGADAVCVPPRDFLFKDRDLKKMERVMRGILADCDTALIRKIFGNDWERTVASEKNTAKRIRIEGMLYQIVLWQDMYNILFV